MRVHSPGRRSFLRNLMAVPAVAALAAVPFILGDAEAQDPADPQAPVGGKSGKGPGTTGKGQTGKGKGARGKGGKGKGGKGKGGKGKAKRPDPGATV